ncbi:hypothetical protein M0813_03368 [Anaeramoeba flamelloides]|uniref:Uncharacterized protein n=1 Tax=Anaeramoeba flamelloides TaxID=1746091 RepID=A0ABQ8Y0P0_9EUKA|nr:hypothetical protein M0813_03368 [Anaeramoeba flamelloides]
MKKNKVNTEKNSTEKESSSSSSNSGEEKKVNKTTSESESKSESESEKSEKKEQMPSDNGFTETTLNQLKTKKIKLNSTNLKKKFFYTK